MGLIIPKDVGGTADIPDIPEQQLAPANQPETTLQIPSDVGGSAPAIAQPPPAQQEEAPGFFDFITGASRETPETAELPELQSLTTPVTTGRFGSDMKIAAGMLSSLHEDDQMEIIKTADPEAEFRRDQKGNVIVKLGSGQEALLNAPGFSTADAMQAAAQILAFVPAARMASVGRTLLQKAGIGALGAGTTQAGLQTTSGALGAEDPIKPGEIALAAGLGGAAEMVVPGIQMIRGGRQAAKVGAATDELADVGESVAKARTAQEGLEAATGQKVGLFPGQQTQVPIALEKQSFLANLTPSSRKAAAALKSQNAEVNNAVNTFLDIIAPEQSVGGATTRFRTAANLAIDAAKATREEAASGIYKAAFKQGANTNLAPVKKLIAKGIESSAEGGQIQNTLKNISGLLSGGKKVVDGKEVVLKPTLKKLHSAKIEIDRLLQKTGEGALGNTTKREVVKIKHALVKQMEEASDLYGQARAEFAKNSPAVNALEDSILGKVAKFDDVQVKNISKRIFDPDTSPLAVQQAKKIIREVDPQAWDDLVRAEMERRLGSIRIDLTDAGQTVENVPGQIHNALFGNAKNRKVLYAGLDSETAKNMRYLESVLKRAKMGRPGGSPTATREEIKKELQGGVFQAIRNFVASPIKSAAGVGSDAMFARRTRAMADLVFNPDWAPKMQKLRKLNMNSPDAARAMAQLIKDAEEGQKDE